MGMSGPAPFYNLQDLHAAQGEPHDPTGDMTQYDQQAQPVPDMGMSVDPNAPPPMMGAPAPAPQMPLTQPGPPTAPPASPMGPMGPVATPPPTGDLTQNVPDLQTRMQQYLAMTQRVYGGMKQPEYSPEEIQDRPNMLSRILLGVATMGRTEDAWNQRAAQRSQYNMRVHQHNAEMDYRAFDEAHKLMQADQNAQLAQANFGLRQQHASLEMLRAQAAENDRQLTNYIRSLDAQRKQQQIDMDTPFAGGTSTPGATSPSTGAYEPPAPGSPLADLGDETTPETSTTTTPTSSTTTTTGLTIQPGETPRNFVKRKDEARKNAAKELATTSTTKTMRETAPKVLDLVNKVEDTMNRVSTGPIASRYHHMKADVIGMADPDWAAYHTNVGLLQTLLMRMHVGARGGTEMMAHFRKLIDDAKQSPENMKAALAEIKDYARSVSGEHIGDATGEPTPAEGVPTSETPDTDVESIFKKHGY